MKSSRISSWSTPIPYLYDDLNGAVIHSKVYHFADDTNMLYISNSLKDINRKFNYDLRHIVEWLRANVKFTQNRTYSF